MVEVQVTVHYQRHLPKAYPSSVERSRQRSTPRVVVSIDIGVVAHAGIDEHEAVGMVHHVAQDRLDTTGSGAGLLGWTNEVAKVNTSDSRIMHISSLHR
jgi:hypothetical protein